MSFHKHKSRINQCDYSYDKGMNLQTIKMHMWAVPLMIPGMLKPYKILNQNIF